MLPKLEQKVGEIVDQNQQDIVDMLRELVTYRTISPANDERAEGNDFQRHQARVGQFLRDLRFSVETWEIDATQLEDFPGSGIEPEKDLRNMPVVVGTSQSRGGGRSLILNGHYDVVPPGDEANWSHPPFAAEMSDGRVYGRGTSDMKGGITAMLQALSALAQAGVELDGDVIVQVVPEEEANSMGTLAVCQRGYKADAAIIPEPTSMNLLIAMRGNASGKIIVHGRAGHADRGIQPHWTEGGAVNAIYKAVKIIQGFEDLTREWSTRPDKQHKYVNPDMVMPTIIRGGEWLITYPERVEIQFTANHIPSTQNLAEEIREKVIAIAATDPWMKAHPPTFIPYQSLYGAEVAEDEPIVQLVREAAHDLGLAPRFIGADSLTDAVHLINYAKVPTVSIGPFGQRAHQIDEYIEIDELTLHTKLLAVAIMRWCGVA